MQPLDPREVAQRIAAERKQAVKRQAKGAGYTHRRRDVEFQRDLKAAGLDIREVRCEFT